MNLKKYRSFNSNFLFYQEFGAIQLLWSYLPLFVDPLNIQARQSRRPCPRSTSSGAESTADFVIVSARCDAKSGPVAAHASRHFAVFVVLGIGLARRQVNCSTHRVLSKLTRLLLE